MLEGKRDEGRSEADPWQSPSALGRVPDGATEIFSNKTECRLFCVCRNYPVVKKKNALFADSRPDLLQDIQRRVALHNGEGDRGGMVSEVFESYFKAA